MGVLNDVGKKAATEIEPFIPPFEYNGTEYLNNLELPNRNLFYAGVLSPSEDVSAGTKDNREYFTTACYRLQKVKFPSMKLEWEGPGRGRRYPTLKGVTLNSVVSFTWIEDAFFSVDFYHRRWFNAWFSRQSGRFKSGITEERFGCKFRTITIYPFHYLNKKETFDDPFGDFSSQILYAITFRNLAPIEHQPISFGTTETGEPTIEYSYQCWESRISTQKLDEALIWDPEEAAPPPTGVGSALTEKKRLVGFFNETAKNSEGKAKDGINNEYLP